MAADFFFFLRRNQQNKGSRAITSTSTSIKSFVGCLSFSSRERRKRRVKKGGREVRAWCMYHVLCTNATRSNYRYRIALVIQKDDTRIELLSFFA